MKWPLLLTEVFHVVTHSLVVMGLYNELLPHTPVARITYFLTDLSMGSLVWLRSHYLGQPDKGAFWGLLYGINIVNHCRAVAFLLGQPDSFMEHVYYLAEYPVINVMIPNHLWYVVGTLVDIWFHSWNVWALYLE
jgi:hypothetical protein